MSESHGYDEATEAKLARWIVSHPEYGVVIQGLVAEDDFYDEYWKSVFVSGIKEGIEIDERYKTESIQDACAIIRKLSILRAHRKQEEQADLTDDSLELDRDRSINCRCPCCIRNDKIILDYIRLRRGEHI